MKIETYLKPIMEQDGYRIASTIVIAVGLSILFSAILLDFILYQNKNNTKKEKKSIVETGSMLLFFFLYMLVLAMSDSAASSLPLPWVQFFALSGALVVLVGALINVMGRVALGGNWSNQIKIYDNHTLIEKGVYKVVRHPLYSSIILMFIGGSISYVNGWSLLLVFTVFVPLMVYRARQEEKELMLEFPKYLSYQKRTGMLFPKVIKRRG